MQHATPCIVCESCRRIGVGGPLDIRRSGRLGGQIGGQDRLRSGGLLRARATPGFAASRRRFGGFGIIRGRRGGIGIGGRRGVGGVGLGGFAG